MQPRELAFRLLAAASLGYQAFALGILVAAILDTSGNGDLVVAGTFALVGPILAFRWKPRLLFRVACVVQGLICLVFAFLALAFRGHLAGGALALACISYFLAGAGIRARTATVVGGAALMTAVVYNMYSQGTSWENGLPFGIVGLCILGMSWLLPYVHTNAKQSAESTPSSETAL